MIAVERTTTISAFAETIWATLVDFAAISAWASNVDHSCLMSERTEGVGMVRRIQTDGSTIIETVERWEPAVALGYRISGLPPVIKSLTNTWNLVESGSTAAPITRVVLTTEIDAGPRPPQRLIAKAVGKRLGSASEQMLNGLTARVEACINEGAA